MVILNRGNTFVDLDAPADENTRFDEGMLLTCGDDSGRRAHTPDSGADNDCAGWDGDPPNRHDCFAIEPFGEILYKLGGIANGAIE